MRKLIWGAALVLLLAACGGDDAAPTATPSRTPFEPTPLPPTWTPLPPGFVPSPTVTVLPDDPADEPAAQGADVTPGESPGGQQLPPTWTPGAAQARPTVTPRSVRPATGGDAGQSGASSNIPTGTPAPTWTSQPDYCRELQAIIGDVRVYVGQSVTLSWQPIGRFDNYIVEIRHPGGSVVHSAIAPGSSYTVPGDVFTQANVYGWEVRAIDENGDRVCYAISGEIITSFP